MCKIVCNDKIDNNLNAQCCQWLQLWMGLGVGVGGGN